MHNNKNPYQYQAAIESQFQSICDPLFSLGIKWFGYIKIFQDGSYLLAAPSHKELLRQYCLHIKCQGISPTIEIESSPVGLSHYSMFSSDIAVPNKEDDAILHLFYSFGLWPIFVIYKNRLDFIEVYCFAMDKGDNCSMGFYLNNLSILEHFCCYFNDRAKDIIDCSDKRKLGLFDQKFNLLNKENKKLFDCQIEEFLKKTSLQKRGLSIIEDKIFPLGEEGKRHKPEYYTRGISGKDFLSPLTHRQKECLFLLTRGKTAKQIGQTLRISHRTVETHIVSLKNKMHCTTKDQLIEKVFDAEVFNISSSR